MIRTGMVSATFREKRADDILRLCREAGLEGIEWSENAHVMPGDPKGAEALLEKTQAAGLSVAAYGSYYRLGENENPEETFRASLVSAKALKAPLIRIWAGTAPSETVSRGQREALAKEAGLICRMAKSQNIRVALEWHKNTLTDTNASALKFLDETGDKNLYCLWQPTVALSMEQREEGLRLLRNYGQGDRLLNLHIYYWLDGVRRPLSEGVEEWKRYLRQINPKVQRFGLLEFVMNNTEEQFLKDAAVLHELLGR